jgi:hypothetical protein
MPPKDKSNLKHDRSGSPPPGEPFNKKLIGAKDVGLSKKQAVVDTEEQTASQGKGQVFFENEDQAVIGNREQTISKKKGKKKAIMEDEEQIITRGKNRIENEVAVQGVDQAASPLPSSGNGRAATATSASKNMNVDTNASSAVGSDSLPAHGAPNQPVAPPANKTADVDAIAAAKAARTQKFSDAAKLGWARKKARKPEEKLKKASVREAEEVAAMMAKGDAALRQPAPALTSAVAGPRVPAPLPVAAGHPVSSAQHTNAHGPANCGSGNLHVCPHRDEKSQSDDQHLVAPASRDLPPAINHSGPVDSGHQHGARALPRAQVPAAQPLPAPQPVPTIHNAQAVSTSRDGHILPIADVILHVHSLAVEHGHGAAFYAAFDAAGPSAVDGEALPAYDTAIAAITADGDGYAAVAARRPTPPHHGVTIYVSKGTGEPYTYLHVPNNTDIYTDHDAEGHIFFQATLLPPIYGGVRVAFSLAAGNPGFSYFCDNNTDIYVHRIPGGVVTEVLQRRHPVPNDQ